MRQLRDRMRDRMSIGDLEEKRIKMIGRSKIKEKNRENKKRKEKKRKEKKRKEKKRKEKKRKE